MYQSPRMRRLRNDLAALERLQSESSRLPLHSPRANPPALSYPVQGQELVARSRPRSRLREKHQRRDQAGGVVSPDDARDSLADADLPPEHLRDRHGVPGRVRHALGAQRAARRAVHHALGHGCAITITTSAAHTTARPRSGLRELRPTISVPDSIPPARSRADLSPARRLGKGRDRGGDDSAGGPSGSGDLRADEQPRQRQRNDLDSSRFG